MALLSKVWSAGQQLLAADLNQNFTDVLNKVKAMPAAWLAGSIPASKMLDNNALTWVQWNLIPPNADADYTTLDGATLPSAEATFVKYFRPFVKPGYKLGIVGIQVTVENYDTVSPGANYAHVSFRKNNTTLLGGASGQLTANGQVIVFANNDPVNNPLEYLADGDWIRMSMWVPTGTVTPANVEATLTLKHILVPS